MGFWGWFYTIAVGLTLLHGVVPAFPKYGRHHSLGAEILAVSWLAAHASRSIFNDPTPLAAYAAIDAMTAWVFLAVALGRKAIWAAMLVIIHAGMGALHLVYFAIGQGDDYSYIVTLNGLFCCALLTINTAILAGRHEWGSTLDSWLHHRAGGWTFSGLRLSRFAGNSGQAR